MKTLTHVILSFRNGGSPCQTRGGAVFDGTTLKYRGRTIAMRIGKGSYPIIVGWRGGERHSTHVFTLMQSLCHMLNVAIYPMYGFNEREDIVSNLTKPGAPRKTLLLKAAGHITAYLNRTDYDQLFTQRLIDRRLFTRQEVNDHAFDILCRNKVEIYRFAHLGFDPDLIEQVMNEKSRIAPHVRLRRLAKERMEIRLQVHVKRAEDHYGL